MTSLMVLEGRRERHGQIRPKPYGSMGDHAGSHLVLALEMTRLGIGSEELVCGQ